MVRRRRPIAASTRSPLEEASTVFADPLGRITDDPRHSEGEERVVLLGKTPVDHELGVATLLLLEAMQESPPHCEVGTHDDEVARYV